MTRFEGKVVAVTGGILGIGKETAARAIGPSGQNAAIPAGDLANPILFLAADQASWVTGAVQPVVGSHQRKNRLLAHRNQW